MKKHVVITGGAKGIGESAVRIFIREDYRVTILDIDSKAGSKLSKELGDDVFFIKCDMANEDMIKKSFSKAIAHFGEISILVNNVGIVIYGTVTTTTLENWDLTMNVNLRSY
ncbi:MAG: SDR family oxidoreductase, partial [Cyclobacteriaceae bacterium]